MTSSRSWYRLNLWDEADERVENENKEITFKKISKVKKCLKMMAPFY